jgi:CheY-like chemotaxis protein
MSMIPGDSVEAQAVTFEAGTRARGPVSFIHPSGQLSRGSSRMPQTAQAPLVLVIDDDRDTRELYRLVLDMAGYRAAEASDVEEAARITALLRPDIALCDWRLPDGDGLVLASRLRTLPGTRRLPLVAVTGTTLRGDALTAARAAGFERVLLKPALPDAILQTVQRILEGRQQMSLRRAAITTARYAARLRCRTSDRPSGDDLHTLLDRASRRAGDGIALLLADDAATFVAANEQAAGLTGYDQTELEAMTVWDLTPLASKADGRVLWNAFIASGLQEGRYLLRRRDGTLVEATYCAVANVVQGLHVSALLVAAAIPETVRL